MKYVELLDPLFLGSRPETTADIDRLRLDSGITAVLNLQTDDDMRAVNLVWEPLEAHYRNSGIELCRVPVRDFDPVDLREKLPECVRALDHLLAASHSRLSPLHARCFPLAHRGDCLPLLVSRVGFGRGRDLRQKALAVLAEYGGSPTSRLELRKVASLW